MTETKFDQLWTQIGNVAQDIVNTCKDGTTFNTDKKSYISFEYDKLRVQCKQMHMNVSDEEPVRIDRHKVASCIAGAILRARPMEYEDINKFPGKERIKMSFLANETLALFTSLGIVKSFIKSDKDNQLQLDEYCKQKFLENGFIFPEPKHDEYIPWLLYLLHDSIDIGFNILSFSNILYLIEEYTFARIELRRYEDEKTESYT